MMMKNIIASFLVFLICSILCTATGQDLRVVAKLEPQVVYTEKGSNEFETTSEFDAYASKIINKSGYSDELEIQEGEALKPKLLHHITLGRGQLPDKQNWRNYANYKYSSGARIEVKYPESDNWFSISYDMDRGLFTGLNSLDPIIFGPAKLRVRVFGERSYWTQNNDNAEKRAAELQGIIGWSMFEKITLSSTSGATTKAQSLVLPEGSGDLTIIMEGSNDLINWTREDLGKKPEANRKTFYRIRAVKE